MNLFVYPPPFLNQAPPRPISPTIHKMVTDLNRPLQETYAATLPPVAEVRVAAPPPKPVDMSVDLNKILDPIEILEMALKDKAPEVVQAPAAVAAPVPVAEPAPVAPVAEPEPVPFVTTPQPAQAPAPAAAPALAPEPAPAPAPAPASFNSNPGLSSFMGQGPVGWKSIKPPGLKC